MGLISDLKGNPESPAPVIRAFVIADMSIFGHCPAHDDFYLVVCNHCSQVVKPQAFQKHCGEGSPEGEIRRPGKVEHRTLTTGSAGVAWGNGGWCWG